jgi:hypothetical protein
MFTPSRVDRWKTKRHIDWRSKAGKKSTDGINSQLPTVLTTYVSTTITEENEKTGQGWPNGYAWESADVWREHAPPSSGSTRRDPYSAALLPHGFPIDKRSISDWDCHYLNGFAALSVAVSPGNATFAASLPAAVADVDAAETDAVQHSSRQQLSRVTRSACMGRR